MASLSIYGKKTLKNLLLWNQRTDFHELWYVAQGILAHIFCSHYDPGMTLTYFTARSNFATWAFMQEKIKMMEMFAACGLEIG